MVEVAIGFIGVLVGVLATGAKEYLSERRASRKSAEYLAVRVSCLLDRFVYGCASVVGDDGLVYGQPDEDGYRRIRVPAPEFSPLSLDLDWKALPAKLMYDILTFPDQVESASHQVDGAFEFAACPPDFEEGFEERRYQYSTVGLHAADLAARVRRTYGLPEVAEGDWDPVAYLVERKERIEEVREARVTRHRELFAT